MKIRTIWHFCFLISIFGCCQNNLEVNLDRIKTASVKLKPLHSIIAKSKIDVRKDAELINVNSVNIASCSNDTLRTALVDVLKVCDCSQIYILKDCQIFMVGQKEQLFKTENYYVIESKIDCLPKVSKLLQLELIEKLDENWCLFKEVTSVAN